MVSRLPDTEKTEGSIPSSPTISLAQLNTFMKKHVGKYDWAKLQSFYDEGNSWKKVCEKFGCHNKSIQLAVKRGDLKSRKRGESISLALGGDGRKRAHNTRCLNCDGLVVTLKSRSVGKYCSLKCFHEHRYENEFLPRVIGGVAGHESVRTYLLRLNPFCVLCGQGEIWNGKPLSLHLDHMDGDSSNNQLSNVRLLCPHCHSQTDNFGIKNKGTNSRRALRLKEWRKNTSVGD